VGKMNYINQNLHGTKVLHLLLELTIKNKEEIFI